MAESQVPSPGPGREGGSWRGSAYWDVPAAVCRPETWGPPFPLCFAGMMLRLRCRPVGGQQESPFPTLVPNTRHSPDEGACVLGV